MKDRISTKARYVQDKQMRIDIRAAIRTYGVCYVHEKGERGEFYYKVDRYSDRVEYICIELYRPEVGGFLSPGVHDILKSSFFENRIMLSLNGGFVGLSICGEIDYIKARKKFPKDVDKVEPGLSLTAYNGRKKREKKSEFAGNDNFDNYLEVYKVLRMNKIKIDDQLKQLENDFNSGKNIIISDYIK